VPDRLCPDRGDHAEQGGRRTGPDQGRLKDAFANWALIEQGKLETISASFLSMTAPSRNSVGCERTAFGAVADAGLRGGLVDHAQR
jgi:hypothetical protein